MFVWVRSVLAVVGRWARGEPSPEPPPLWRVTQWRDDAGYVVQIYRNGEWFAGACSRTSLNGAWRGAQHQRRTRLRAMRRLGRGLE